MITEIASFGANLEIMTVVFTFIHDESYIIKSMSRNRFLLGKLAELNRQALSPNWAIWLVGLLAAALAGEFGLYYLALISSVGLLMVSGLISAIVIIV